MSQPLLLLLSRNKCCIVISMHYGKNRKKTANLDIFGFSRNIDVSDSFQVYCLNKRSVTLTLSLVSEAEAMSFFFFFFNKLTQRVVAIVSGIQCMMSNDVYI